MVYGILKLLNFAHGDVYMIGAFMGWQAAVLTFFLGPFFGLAHALGKLVRLLKKKWFDRGQLSSR